MDLRKIIENASSVEDLNLIEEYLKSDYLRFTPREDSVGDEQTRFLTDEFNGIKCVIGGNGCFAYGTKVLMYDGSIKEIQDIVVGDKVMGDDGKVRNVLCLHAGKELMYKVSSKNSHYIVNENHVLVYNNYEQDLVRNVLNEKDLKGIKVDLKSHYSLHYSINVEPVGVGDYYGFECDGNHLFLLSDFTVVHNSGKSQIACYAMVEFLMNNEPPMPNSPIIIASQNYDMVGSLWNQKFSHMIPSNQIDKIHYLNRTANYPKHVILKKNSLGNNWILNFHSYEQGREAFQSIEICGFVLDEQIPKDIFEEIYARTRTYYYPNSKFYVLTPLEPDPELMELYDNRLKPYVAALWRFYRLNTAKNKVLSEEWLNAYFANLSPEMRATRMAGDFLKLEGLVYDVPEDCIIDPFDIHADLLGLDFGWRNCGLVFIADTPDCYYVVDELLLKETLTSDLAEIISSRGTFTIFGDSADPQSIYSLRAKGIYVAPANKSVFTGIECIKGLLSNKKMKIFNTCKQFIKELRAYRWKPDTGRGEIKDEVIKREDHLMDAWRYAIYNRQLSKGHSNVITIPQVRKEKRGLFS